MEDNKFIEWLKNTGPQGVYEVIKPRTSTVVMIIFLVTSLIFFPGLDGEGAGWFSKDTEVTQNEEDSQESSVEPQGEPVETSTEETTTTEVEDDSFGHADDVTSTPWPEDDELEDVPVEPYPVLPGETGDQPEPENPEEYPYDEPQPRVDEENTDDTVTTTQTNQISRSKIKGFGDVNSLEEETSVATTQPWEY